MPTNFGTGFGPSFGMSGWNNQQMTTPTKQQKFPGLSDDQIKRLESLTSNPQEQQKLYQQAIQQLKQQNTTDNRIAAENEMNYRSMNEKNPQQANYLQSNVRLEQLADLTKGAFGLDASADTQQVVNGLMAMAQDNGVSLSLLNDYLDHGDEEFLYQMGLKQDPALQTNPDALSIKGSIANANEDKGEWNDNFFGRLETKGVEEGAGFWKNAGRFIGNVAKSGVNVLSDVGNMILNPLDTANALAKTAVGAGMNLLGTDDDIENMQDGKLKDWYMSANETADTVGQFFKERYGGGEEILNTLFTDPVGVISDVASILEGGAGAVRGIAKGGAKGAAKAGLKGAARTLDNVAEGAGKVSRVAGTYDPYAVAMRAETQLPIKAISATVDVAKKVPGAAAKMKNNLNVALDKAVGLDNNTRLAIQSNPFSKEVWQKAKTYIDANGLPEKSTEVSKQLITDVADRVQDVMLKQMDEIGETGPMYQPLREAGYSVDLSAAKAKLPEILEEYGITVNENGRLDFSKSSISSEASDIQKIYNRIENTDAPMSMDEYLRFRKTASDMVNFNPNNKNYIGKKIADTPGDKVIKAIREAANDTAHEQVAPLKDLDAVYNKQMSLIQEVTDGIVYKDKSKAGAVRDNINQIIKNLDEPNRRVLKNRLEKVLPGIEEEVKAINMLPKLIDNYYRPSKVQKYAAGTAGSIIGSAIGGGPLGGIIGAGVGYWLSGKIDKLKSAKWDKIISTTSKEGADKMADIQNRIANNQKITQAQKAFLNEISNKLKAGKQVKEGEIARIIGEVASAEDGDVLSVIDRSIQELKTIGAKEEIKELTEMRDNIQKAMNEEADMNRYAQDFEAEKQSILNEAADQRLPEFKRRIYQLGQEERRIGAVANKKIGKTFEGRDFKNRQNTEWLKKKEGIIKDIEEYYNVDQFEAAEIFDRIERQAGPDDLYGSKNAKYQIVEDSSKLTPEEVEIFEQRGPFGLENLETLHLVQDIQKGFAKSSASNSLEAGGIAAMIDNIRPSLRNGEYPVATIKRTIDLINDAAKKETKNGKGLSQKEFQVWESELKEGLGFSKSQASSKTAKYQVANETITKDSSGKQLSKQQQDFFKGSKVVDKDGNLLRVYHGTRGGDFTVFKKGNSWSNNLAKVGYWFTPNKEGALKFAESSWGGDAKPRAEEVYLDIKNPKIYEPSEFNLLKNEERNVKIDEQRKIYNQKADKADGLDYTKAGGFFHDEFDHPYYEREIFQYLKRSWENDKKYDGKYGKYNPEEYRKLAEERNRNRDANLDYDKILKDFEEYTKAKLDEEKEYSKLLDIKHSDPYDDFMYDIYKLDSNYDNKWTKDDLNMALNDYDSPNKFVEKLKSEGYDGIIIKGTEYDGEVIGGGARNDQYVAFDSNQIKRITNENPTKNEDIRYQKYGTAGKNEKGMTATEGLNIRNFKNGKTVQELANQYGIDTKIVDGISTPEGQRAYGMYGDRLITLSKDLKESTVPHELLHGVFDMVDSKRRTSILEGIQKNLNVDNVQAEEWLADSFSEYYRTGKFGTKGLAKGLVEKVKQFFYEVKSYIDGTYKNEKQIRQLFDDIIDGKIEGEYGVYSDPKFQSVWHGSPYEFEKFDSSHMGEGEGAQLHGWGHYVAKNKDTAKNYYAEMGAIKYKGKQVGGYSNLVSHLEELGLSTDEINMVRSIAKDMQDNSVSASEAKSKLLKRWEENLRGDLERVDNAKKRGNDKNLEDVQFLVDRSKKLIDTIKDIDENDFNKRHLYEVEIPDPIKKDTPTGSNYWEERDSNYTKEQIEKIGKELAKKIEGKPLEEATMKDVENIAKAMHNKLSPDAQKMFVENVKEWVDKGHDIKTAIEDNIAYYTSLSSTADGWLEAAGLRPQGKYYDAIQLWRQGSQGRNIYTKISSILGGDKEASKFLESLGYDGIHYFGGRDGESYVIFNDDALQINKHHKY